MDVMGDTDGRRGAGDGTVTVRATRQLTDRHTWGIAVGKRGGRAPLRIPHHFYA